MQIFIVELGWFSKSVLYHHVFQEKPSIMDDFKWWWWSWKFWKETNFGWRWWEFQWNWDFQQKDQSWKWKCFQQAYGNWLSLCLVWLCVCHNHTEPPWFFKSYSMRVWYHGWYVEITVRHRDFVKATMPKRLCKITVSQWFWKATLCRFCKITMARCDFSISTVILTMDVTFAKSWWYNVIWANS